MSWLETRKIPVLFAVATLLPMAALCWLGIRTLEQDRDLERQRRRDRLDVTARRVALDIEQDLQRIEAQLAGGDGIRFLPSGIVTPAYQRIASASSDPDRGEALVALGGLLRKQRRFDEARRAYGELETLGTLPRTSFIGGLARRRGERPTPRGPAAQPDTAG